MRPGLEEPAPRGSAMWRPKSTGSRLDATPASSARSAPVSAPGLCCVGPGLSWGRCLTVASPYQEDGRPLMECARVCVAGGSSNLAGISPS